MVYFVSNGDHVKIGKSKNPLNRIKELQTSNSNKLYFIYLFDVKDKYEKVLHKLFKEYKTDSNNEWFNLNNVDIESVIKGSLRNIPQFLDFNLSKFKADQCNSIVDKNFKENKLKPNTNDCDKSKIKKVLEDIKYCLKYKKDKRISYHKYIVDYGFTKEQITFFVKSAKLNKLVAKHNNSI